MALFGAIEIAAPGKAPVAVLVLVLSAGLLVRYIRTVVLLSTQWGMRRAAEKVGKAHQVHKATVAGDGLTVRVDKKACSYDWEAFGGFVETERQFILWDPSGEPVCSLPKRGFADPSLVPVCGRLIAERLTAA
ncbi:hypothetical protein [Streptomyces sp. NPDC007264]|uniref:hypothetical protein n=1 Tax=Streptomyces sp. NPDC007264 TaxID=3364777 RepID=UPI0036D82D3F